MSISNIFLWEEGSIEFGEPLSDCKILGSTILRPPSDGNPYLRRHPHPVILV